MLTGSYMHYPKAADCEPTAPFVLLTIRTCLSCFHHAGIGGQQARKLATLQNLLLPP